MNNQASQGMEFSADEELSLKATFRAVFKEPKGLTLSSTNSGRECKNHFDDKFHQELLDGLYSKERLT